MNDTAQPRAMFAPFHRSGIAFHGQSCNAGSNFVGHPSGSVATPATADDPAAWQATHPQGGAVAALDSARPVWPPLEIIPFRHAVDGLWRSINASPEHLA